MVTERTRLGWNRRLEAFRLRVSRTDAIPEHCLLGVLSGALAGAVIIATGARYRRLGVLGEDKLVGHGVSFCATCDGAFFRDQEIAVVGGGDTAMEEALFLTRFASKVYLLHRRDELRASKIMQERVLAHDKIEVLWNTEIVSFQGDPKSGLEGLRIADNTTGEERDLPLFRSSGRGRGRDTLTERPMSRNLAWHMVKRRARDAGLGAELCNHSFRSTGITDYLRNSGTLEVAARIAGHASTRTTQLYDRRQDEISLDEIERIHI